MTMQCDSDECVMQEETLLSEGSAAELQKWRLPNEKLRLPLYYW